MNKAAIQRFAIQARTDLIDQVSQRAYQFGITKDGYGEANAVTVGGRALNTDEQRQRKELVEQIRQKGYAQVMEEVAYTWFNRFIALRFMEVNNYLPSHIRIFSDSTGAFKPEILNDALHLDMPGLNMDKVAEYIEKNQTEDLYRYLLLTQCNALNDALPQMFEKLGGFSELLLPNNILKQDSVLGRMVTDIPEDDWTDQVQIIGWLYQYYNTDLKAEVLGKSDKILKHEIPAATQLFTPDWIVRYMVENSLGRLWQEGHPDDELKTEWKYYLDEAQQEADVQAQLEEIRTEYRNIKPQDIKVIDPCMGSGHILVYAFDVLVQIYKKYGISERDAAQSILEYNLYGLDIDDRAAQLAYFAVMMKARQYDRRIFTRGIQPHICSIIESNFLDASTIEYFTNNNPKLQKDFRLLLDEMRDAKEYGSILNISQVDFAALYARVDEVRKDINICREIVLNDVLPFLKSAENLAQKYNVTITNPPYLSVSGANGRLSEYVRKKYSDSKNDLYSVFIERCQTFTLPHFFQAMITQQAWMFTAIYEGLRNKIAATTIINLLQLGSRGFDEINGEVVQTASFVIRNDNLPKYHSSYMDLTRGNSEANKEAIFHSRDQLYTAMYSDFHGVPNSSMAYWLSHNALCCFSKSKLSDYATTREGMTTADNDRFLRNWYEVVFGKIMFSCTSLAEAKESGFKWFPYNKGGANRKWYGNNDLLVNWENDGSEIKNLKDTKTGRIRSHNYNAEYSFRESGTWTAICSGDIMVRFSQQGALFDSKGASVFALSTDKLLNIIGMLNSAVSGVFLKVLSPSFEYKVGHVANVPLLSDHNERVTDIVNDCIELSRRDWDAFETSWDFKQHPLVEYRHSLSKVNAPDGWYLKNAFEAWEYQCLLRFDTLKANEEELNRIFIDLYGLQDELTQEVDDKDVTIRRADLESDIRSLISYAVGCMFGRYSLDVDGLAYAGGEWDTSKYSSYVPDKDNIIPICDDDYFDDDITGRFVKWVETVYGSETLEENLKFIADVLGGKGTPREVIRSYFINDFYADHLKVYQKRPIYWLFDSGKKNGFKALIYMHRYQSDLLARMRTDYVHEQQERYRTQLMHIADAIDHASASERVKLTKQQKKLQEQSLEIQKYEEKIHHLADQNIQIDLDDGVNHNYELFADVLAKRK